MFNILKTFGDSSRYVNFMVHKAKVEEFEKGSDSSGKLQCCTKAETNYKLIDKKTYLILSKVVNGWLRDILYSFDQ